MPASIENLLERAQTIMPELKIKQIERNEEGLINDVLIVNQKWVFRFAKSEEYARRLQNEMKILDLVRPQLDVQVPKPIYQGVDSMVYPLLTGQTLSRKLVMGYDEYTRIQIAGQLGKFLNLLHRTDVSKASWEIPATRAPVRRMDWLEIQGKVKEKLYPLFQKYQIEWVEELFNSVLDDPNSSVYEPSLIHGDLASYHILFEAHEQKITGVIDFGMAGLGDVASDIGNLIQIYGESFVCLMQKNYPGLESVLPRARFYAQLLELEWVLRGFESGESFWFTAHLGGARDIC